MPILPVISKTAMPATTAPAVHHSLQSLLTHLANKIRLEDLTRQNHFYNWLILLGAVFLGVAAGRVAANTLRKIGEHLEARKWHFQALLVQGAAGPGNLFLFTLFFLAGISQLHLAPALRGILARTILLLVAVVFFWYLFNLVSTVELALKKFISRHDTALTEQLLPIVRKTLRIFITIIGALFILQDVFNRDIGSWLAGLGIAGLAVSLAAQDSLKNFFGSITLLFDRPYVVGHWVAYQGFSGTVEEIGFRSTRLRLFDGTLVTIPNSDIVNSSVQNYSLRPYIRRHLNITIPYDTPVEKTQQAVAIIKDILNTLEFRDHVHDPINPALFPPRVHFNDFNAASLNIQVYYYFRPAGDYWGYMAYNECFNLALMQAYTQAGIEFSFPTQTLYLAGDPKRKLPLFPDSDTQANDGT
ncbi:MAG: mechanosensitive ion channel family protein [Planctomycetes bacterium]|nr:mechanosensitive ion channel family protein [Planctomycetota bacterium]